MILVLESVINCRAPPDRARIVDENSDPAPSGDPFRLISERLHCPAHASSHASLPSFLIAAAVPAAPPRRELTQITFAPASAIAIAIAWPRPLLAPVTMAISPSSENGLALGIVRGVEVYLLNPRNEQMDDEQR